MMGGVTADPVTADPVTPDPWAGLRGRTAARIALGRAGASLPTSEVLGFAMAHAAARDAVHAALDVAAVATGLETLGLVTIAVRSAAPDRSTYLARPDLGRALDAENRETLAGAQAIAPDLVLVVADGLSATAVERNAAPLLAALLPKLSAAGVIVGPVAVATQARVALGDEIGAALRARMVAVLIGERPGLSSPDSLGVYLTFDPRPGRRDSERNCLSNIRVGGLSPEAAAATLAWLIAAALARRLTGVGLKDESTALTGAAPQALSRRA